MWYSNRCCIPSCVKLLHSHYLIECLEKWGQRFSALRREHRSSKRTVMDTCTRSTKILTIRNIILLQYIISRTYLLKSVGLYGRHVLLWMKEQTFLPFSKFWFLSDMGYRYYHYIIIVCTYTSFFLLVRKHEFNITFIWKILTLFWKILYLFHRITMKLSAL